MPPHTSRGPASRSQTATCIRRLYARNRYVLEPHQYGSLCDEKSYYYGKGFSSLASLPASAEYQRPKPELKPCPTVRCTRCASIDRCTTTMSGIGTNIRAAHAITNTEYRTKGRLTRAAPAADVKPFGLARRPRSRSVRLRCQRRVCAVRQRAFGQPTVPGGGFDAQIVTAAGNDDGVEIDLRVAKDTLGSATGFDVVCESANQTSSGKAGVQNGTTPHVRPVTRSSDFYAMPRSDSRLPLFSTQYPCR
jgi:hypothetical protein